MDTLQRYALFGLLILFSLLALIRDFLFYREFPTGRNLLVTILSIFILIAILVLGHDIFLQTRQWIANRRVQVGLVVATAILVVVTFLLRQSII
jgi:hypothetical protein